MAFYNEELSKLPNIIHGFSNKAEGILKKDNPQEQGFLVKLQKFANELKVPKEKLKFVTQTHSNKVTIVDSSYPSFSFQGDAMVTAEKGIVLCILTADCVPVLFVDPNAGVVGAAHAGWKGALHHIINETVKKMLELGANPNNIKASLGPCIWQDSYEVDQSFYEDFNNPDFFKKGRVHHWQFDLPGYVMDKIRQEGIQEIYTPSHNTYIHPELFYSYRRYCHQNLMEYGNQISAIGLR